MKKPYIFGILFVFILFALLASGSYYRSKSAAEELVGDTLKYYQLSKVRMVLEPFERKKIVWSFKFSYPDALDEEFRIYTSLWGTVVLTNPLDLENRLRRFEKLDVHPSDKKQGGILEEIEKRAQNEDIYIIDARECNKHARVSISIVDLEGISISEQIERFVAVNTFKNPRPLFVKVKDVESKKNVHFYTPINALLFREVCSKDAELIYNYLSKKHKDKHPYSIYLRSNDNYVYKTKDIIIAYGYSLEEICSYEFHSYPEDEGEPCRWHDQP